MKRYKLFMLFLTLVTGGLSAQLVNDGGTITVQSGAILVVETDVSNINSGTIVNNGVIEVTGDFTNSATVTSGAASKLTFKGDMNSDFTPGTATYAIVQNDKTDMDVTLLGDLEVAEQVNFAGTSNVVLGGNDVVLADAATTNGTQATGYFVTAGAGVVVKEMDDAEMFNFDVGDATNYTPVSADVTGTFTPGTSTVAAKVTPSVHPNKPADADDYINRYWDVDASTITSYSADLVGTFVAPGDVTGTVGDVSGARYEATTWEYATGAGTASTVSATTTAMASELTGTNFYGKTDLSVFLEGGYSGSAMSTSLTLPLTSPYGDAPLTVASTPAMATDWVKIEIRDAGNPATVISKYSAFVLNDGNIVAFDGSIPTMKDAPTTGFVAIYHRNHLPMRSSSVVDFVTVSKYDFSTALTQAYDNTGFATDAMKDLGSGVFGMWKANVNGDTNVNIVDFFQTKANTSPTLSGVYSNFDVNMDTNVNIVDFFQAKVATSPTKPAHL